MFMKPQEKFRLDLLARFVTAKAVPLHVAKKYGVEQASLSRFMRGKAGLSFDNIVALWPFVYGEDFAFKAAIPRTKRASAAPAPDAAPPAAPKEAAHV